MNGGPAAVCGVIGSVECAAPGRDAYFAINDNSPAPEDALPPLTDRFKAFPVYPLAHVPARKRELLQRGVDVIDLGAGDAL